MPSQPKAAGAATAHNVGSKVKSSPMPPQCSRLTAVEDGPSMPRMPKHRSSRARDDPGAFNHPNADSTEAQPHRAINDQPPDRRRHETRTQNERRPRQAKPPGPTIRSTSPQRPELEACRTNPKKPVLPCPFEGLLWLPRDCPASLPRSARPYPFRSVAGISHRTPRACQR